MLNIVLFQPEIPHNTGAVGRLCLATGATLHLIKPLGFSLEDKYLKRSGLDYWAEVDVQLWDSWESLQKAAGAAAHFVLMECSGRRPYWEANLMPEGPLYLVFGPETRSIPASIIAAHPDGAWQIPMQGTRSLNLSTSVAIVLYEAVRQRALRAP